VTVSRTINILPENLANRIAAGEVVQRPESVVKELVENSLDAGARSVIVAVRDAGKTYIQVSDDGIGMSAEDAVTAFERHATSKIATYDDLEAIRTLGFRGEALASIAAVAQVELKTRRRGEAAGTRVRIAGGARDVVEPVGMEPGTAVGVKNLFFNTPARRNFLKSDGTEFKRILDTLQHAAIAWPGTSFTFASSDEIVFDVAAVDTEEQRIRDLFGERYFESLVPVREESDLLAIHGYISKPEFARKTRTEQIFLLNRRFITSRALGHAVFSGYEHLVEKASFPFFVLFIEIDPHRVDVNVHPSKLEVKFEDESGVYRMIHNAVRRALGTHDLIPVLTSVERNGTFSPEPIPPQAVPGHPQTEMRLAFLRTAPAKGGRGPSTSPATGGGTELHVVSSGERASVPPAGAPGGGEEPRIYQLHNKYILSQIRSGIMLIDQHAAHERILYERAVAFLERNAPASQQLLFPQTVELSPGDFALASELLDDLMRLGFDIQVFGKNTLLVNGIPADVRIGHEAGILRDLLDEYKDDKRNMTLKPRERLAKSFACRAAVKAGDPLSSDEMRSLIDQLFATSIPYSCPHGRPVIVRIPLEEIDGYFGRT